MNIFINRGCGCCNSMPSFPPPRMNCCGFMPGCFGFGFNSCMSNSMMTGLGFGVGMMTGGLLFNAMPSIIKGIGQAGSWLWNKAIAPASSWLWNKAIAPAGRWIGKTVARGATSLANGVKNLWNKVFQKKSTKTEKS